MRPRTLIGCALMLCAGHAQSAYLSTPYVDLDIRMDNGKTYFYGPFTVSSNCQYNRLELGDAGDRFNSIENARKMMALILSARMSGLKVSLGYDDTDGPGCRIAEVYVQW